MDLGGTVANGVLQSGTAELISGSFDYEVETAGQKTLFELGLPRFAYRYKYQNNQYSPFSPFSEVAFLPGEFEYTASNGYNSGMTNHVRRIVLGDFDSPLPADVVELDVLYKQDSATAVYKVDTLSPSDLEINYVEHTITNDTANTVTFSFINTKKNEQEISFGYDKGHIFAVFFYWLEFGHTQQNLRFWLRWTEIGRTIREIGQILVTYFARS